MSFKYKRNIVFCISVFIIVTVNAQSPLLNFEAVNFSQVNITDQFWKPKIEKVATTTLEACVYQTETVTPRIKNFEKVARGKGEKHEGIFYDDSDVFKALEAIAYSLKNHPDMALEKKADEWIEKIAAAQQPDGYLNTYYTLHTELERYSDMSMHEDYNAGHMIEAAVAYFDATGKRKFLDVVIRWANHFNGLFGPGKRNWVTGHQELELALVKLFNNNKDEKYLKLANWLLDQRGHKLAKGYTWTDWKDTAYAQDLLPIKEQTQITGHAVRAMYMYTGVADVAAITGDTEYVNAMRTVWEDVVFRNMYITGGIGSSGNNEGFSKDYDLPNEKAYCETCASVGMVFWNQRMNALTGESVYYDVLEKSLYNGALSGLSLSGDRFFYGNPLASTGQHARREWFGTACCPANITRLVASLGNYIYAKSEKGLWVNLFVGSNTSIPVGKDVLNIEMKTGYPWKGDVELMLLPSKSINYDLHIRIPGWAQSKAVPGDLYHFQNPSNSAVVILFNGKPVEYNMEKGYAVISKKWEKGDKVTIQFPMEIRKVVAKDDLKFDNGRIALQRGPIIYCVEGADNYDEAWNIIIPENASFVSIQKKILSENVVAIQTSVPVVNISSDRLSATTEIRTVTAIPYYTWANRGKNSMQVWLPQKIDDLRINY